VSKAEWMQVVDLRPVRPTFTVCGGAWIATSTHPSSAFPTTFPNLDNFSFKSVYRNVPTLKNTTNAMTDLANLPFSHPRQLPSGDDIPQIKAIIEQLDRSIENLEQNIRQLQTRIEELQQTRANCVSYISPFRRLPTEILIEIISICIEDGADILTIARVCSRLQEVVSGMTGIWSNITLRPIHSGYYPFRDIHGRHAKQYGSSVKVSY
jgi:hypothetical protein